MCAIRSPPRARTHRASAISNGRALRFIYAQALDRSFRRTDRCAATSESARMTRVRTLHQRLRRFTRRRAARSGIVLRAEALGSDPDGNAGRRPARGDRRRRKDRVPQLPHAGVHLSTALPGEISRNGGDRVEQARPYRDTVSVPSVIVPSQVVVPVYVAAIRPAVMSLLDACIVMPHSGVMSSPPAGKSSVSVRAPPDRVPASVPIFCLWHEPHDPSLRFAESRTAAPEIRSPVCVRLHMNVSAPCASPPVPVHVPVRFAADGPGAGAGETVVGKGGVGDAGAGADEPQHASGSSSTALASRARTFTTGPV